MVEKTERYNQNQSFTTLKDRKENFQNNPKCRLINHVKAETGIVSKHYLDQINKSIRERLNVNQWKYTQAVMTWFKNIKTESSSSFIKFDIVDFYPSISKDLLLKANQFCKISNIYSTRFTETILHSRKALLFNKHDVWVKNEKPDFDVTMGSYDGADVRELVGLDNLATIRLVYIEKTG